LHEGGGEAAAAAGAGAGETAVAEAGEEAEQAEALEEAASEAEAAPEYEVLLPAGPLGMQLEALPAPLPDLSVRVQVRERAVRESR
jgi:hypothetical protein